MHIGKGRTVGNDPFYISQNVNLSTRVIGYSQIVPYGPHAGCTRLSGTNWETIDVPTSKAKIFLYKIIYNSTCYTSTSFNYKK